MTKKNLFLLRDRSCPSRGSEKNNHSLVHTLAHKLRADPPNDVLDDGAVQLRDGVGRDEVRHLCYSRTREKKREREREREIAAVESSWSLSKCRRCCFPLFVGSPSASAEVRTRLGSTGPVSRRKETEKNEREGGELRERRATASSPFSSLAGESEVIRGEREREREREKKKKRKKKKQKKNNL